MKEFKRKLKGIYGYIKWLYGYGASHMWAIVIYTLLGLTGTVASLFNSLVSRDLVDIITGHKTSELLITFVLMISVTLATTVINQISGLISTKISCKVENNIKADVFDQIMSSEWEALSKCHAGELTTRWSSDSSSIANGILTFVPNLLIILFRFFGALLMVMRYDASFAIFALASIPISAITSRQSIKRMQKSSMSNMELYSRMSAFNQEAFYNIQTVKAFDMLSVYGKRLRELQDEYANVRLKYQRISVINSFILTIVSLLVTYSAQGWGVYKVWSGAISYGTMTMFISLTATLSASANSLISVIPSSIQIVNASKRLRQLTCLPKEDYSARDEVKAFFEKHKDEGVGMSFRDVSYSYNQHEVVFEKASFDAHPHESVAFVGPSGQGKTTMLRCLLSLLRPYEGYGFITYGDKTPEEKEEDFPAINASARQLMAYVPQGNTMFSGTIASNMRNVKEDATDEEIIDALKLACAWEFVEKLPDGINSEIMERGGGFSEGQAQRLSIARALVRKSPILLLDEATSALDIETEKEVIRNIMKDDYPRTCILTTHRPSVLQVCNRVYKIHDKRCDILTQDEIAKLQREFIGDE